MLPGVQASVLLLLVAFILDLSSATMRAAPGRSRTSAGASAACCGPAGCISSIAPLWLLFLIPGWIAWAIISIWFLYRIARGWLNLNANTPMPMPA